MARRVGIVIALLLVLSACGGGSGKSASPSSSPSTTSKKTTTTTEGSATTTTTAVDEDHVGITDDCPGIGAAPADGEITYSKDGELWAVEPDGMGAHCLIETSAATVAWGGAADRVLAGAHTYVVADGAHEIGDADDRLLGWSRPAGRALLAETADDTLVKYGIDGKPPVGIFDADSTESAYHPAGLSIVIVVPQGDRPGLLMTSNTGENPRWIVENENAKAIHDIAFGANGELFFIADHDDGSQHVHDLVFDSDAPELQSWYEPPAGDTLGAIAASPWDGNIAMGADCSGHAALFSYFDGDPRKFPDEVADAEPIGWLPSGDLVVLTHPDGCGQPGDVYSVDGSTIAPSAHLIAEGVASVAVRAVQPPPPPPPMEIEAAPA